MVLPLHYTKALDFVKLEFTAEYVSTKLEPRPGIEPGTSSFIYYLHFFKLPCALWWRIRLYLIPSSKILTGPLVSRSLAQIIYLGGTVLAYARLLTVIRDSPDRYR